MKTPIRFLFTLLCAAIVSLPSIHAATTWTVQDTGDGAANAANCPGSGCRLRDALAAVSDGDMIDFSVTTPATITLTNGELVVGNSIAITGLGANLLTVDANHASRVFFISSGKTVTSDHCKCRRRSSDLCVELRFLGWCKPLIINGQTSWIDDGVSGTGIARKLSECRPPHAIGMKGGCSPQNNFKLAN